MDYLEALQRSAAWQAAPRSVRRVFQVIEAEITANGGAPTPMPYLSFESQGVGMASLPVALRSAEYLGFVDREVGRHLVNVFRLSDRWRGITESQAERLLAAAREIKSRGHQESGLRAPMRGPQP